MAALTDQTVRLITPEAEVLLAQLPPIFRDIYDPTMKRHPSLFRTADHVCVTDGRAVARIPITPDSPELPKWPRTNFESTMATFGPFEADPVPLPGFVVRPCKECEGKGVLPERKCAECNGSGEEDVQYKCDCPHCDGTHDCEACDGKGKQEAGPCDECDATGIRHHNRKVALSPTFLFFIGLRYADMLRKHAATIYLPKVAGMTPCRFIVGDVEGFVMPIQTYGNSLDDEPEDEDAGKETE